MSPLAIGRSKLTMASVFGLGIPSGGSRLPIKSDIWLKVINWVACGSNLKRMGKHEGKQIIGNCFILGPFSIKHFKVLFNNSYFFLLVCLIEIFKDDGDIHIDDDHEVDNDERHKIDNGYKREATISIWKVFILRITVWWLGHQRIQHVIPTS